MQQRINLTANKFGGVDDALLKRLYEKLNADGIGRHFKIGPALRKVIDAEVSRECAALRFHSGRTYLECWDRLTELKPWLCALSRCEICTNAAESDAELVEGN